MSRRLIVDGSGEVAYLKFYLKSVIMPSRTHRKL